MRQPATLRLRRRAAGTVVVGFAAFAAGLLSAPPPALACSCVPPPPPVEALAAADAVFRGTVQAVILADDALSVTFRVRTVWKGPIVLRHTVITWRDSAACGYPFHVGDDVIVYAEEVDLPSRLATSSCDRTGVFDATEAAALGVPLFDRTADDPPPPNCPRCPIPSAAGAMANADVVFLGQPLLVHESGAEAAWLRRVRFRVLGVWKGDPPVEVDVTVPYLAYACRGLQWLDDPAGALVFAQRDADGGLTISICGRLDRYSAADAESLGPMRPVLSSRVFLPLAARLAHR